MHIFRSFGRLVYQFGRPNSVAEKALFNFFFFFQLYFNKKYVDVAIDNASNYFEMAYNKKMQTEEKSNQKKRSKRKKKMSKKKFSLI